MLLKNSLFLSFVLVALGVLIRLLPHMPNTTPITAIVLFATTYLGLRYSIGILFTSMLIADLFIGFYNWPVMLAVYGSFALASILGLIIRKYKKFTTILGGALVSSLAFFLITNWAVWQFEAMYPSTLSGLIESYVMALPFLKNSLVGDVVYTAMFFGLFEAVNYILASRRNESRVIA